MSIMTCGTCDRYVDTDEFPMETINLNGLEVEVCEQCAELQMDGEDE